MYKFISTTALASLLSLTAFAAFDSASLIGYYDGQESSGFLGMNHAPCAVSIAAVDNDPGYFYATISTSGGDTFDEVFSSAQIKATGDGSESFKLSASPLSPTPDRSIIIKLQDGMLETLAFDGSQDTAKCGKLVKK